METIRTFQFNQDKTIRLDKFLAESWPEFSRVVLQNLIASGKVNVDRVVVKAKSYELLSGQIVSVAYEAPKLKPNPKLGLKKLYEDKDVVVIDKPAGLVVHPNPKNQKPSVAASILFSLESISEVGEDKFRPGIVHRLDADTSGVLIVAKTQSAYEFLKKKFQSRQVYKEYIVLVHGTLPKSHGIIRFPIGRKAGSRRLSAGLGRSAKTEYWVEKVFIDGIDSYSQLRVQLHTGRTHQIRVHFSFIGHPVAGDRLYGGKFTKSDVQVFPRQFLHAHKLRLMLPSGKEKEFISLLPNDLNKVLANLKPVV